MTQNSPAATCSTYSRHLELVPAEMMNWPPWRQTREVCTGIIDGAHYSYEDAGSNVRSIHGPAPGYCCREAWPSLTGSSPDAKFGLKPQVLNGNILSTREDSSLGSTRNTQYLCDALVYPKRADTATISLGSTTQSSADGSKPASVIGATGA